MAAPATRFVVHPASIHVASLFVGHGDVLALHAVADSRVVDKVPVKRTRNVQFHGSQCGGRGCTRAHGPSRWCPAATSRYADLSFRGSRWTFAPCSRTALPPRRRPGWLGAPGSRPNSEPRGWRRGFHPWCRGGDGRSSREGTEKRPCTGPGPWTRPADTGARSPSPAWAAVENMLRTLTCAPRLL